MNDVRGYYYTDFQRNVMGRGAGGTRFLRISENSKKFMRPLEPGK